MGTFISLICNTVNVCRCGKHRPPNSNKYMVNKLLYTGKNRKVYLCEKNSKLYICKVFNTDKKCQRETDVIKLANTRILKGIPLFKESVQKSLFYSFIPGITLFDYNETNALLSIKEIKLITVKILKILKNLHDSKIIHFDLKLENIIINPDTHEISIIDLGQACVLDSVTLHKRNGGGTINFIAPEAKNRIYGYFSDIWAIGVIVHALITGIFLENNEIVRLSGDRIISVEACSFLAQCLDINPQSRLSCTQLLDHFWLKTFNL